MYTMKIVTHAQQQIKVAVDAAIFTVLNGELQLLLIQMKKAPYKGRWALPGGLIAQKERTKDAVSRILQDQTGIKDVYLEQLATFDEPRRDPLRRVISIAHLALVDAADMTLSTTEKYSAVRFWPVSKLPDLAYDHGHMADVAIERLRGKLGYTNIIRGLLPTEFTLTELQEAYEAILGVTLDRRNFRKKFLSLGLLTSVGKKRSTGPSRPATLYRFQKRELVTVNIL